MLGVLLAAASISLWVDFYRLESGTDLALSPDDPGWIGAWWLGLLANGILFFILSSLFLFFPRRLSQKARDRPRDYEEVPVRLNVAGGHGEIKETKDPQLLNAKGRPLPLQGVSLAWRLFARLPSFDSLVRMPPRVLCGLVFTFQYLPVFV